MGKIEVNNEIVLMRHAVRQARVQVVSRLTKEIRLLRKKFGDEKSREKYNRKADRLASEILALKKVKDDDISKFGIRNSKGLLEILTDESSTPNTRILARVVYHKKLKDKIESFKNKFPDCEQYLSSGKKKKKTKKSNKNKKQDDVGQKDAENINNKKDGDDLESIEGDESNVAKEEDTSEEDKKSFDFSDEDDFIQNNTEPGSLIRVKRGSDESESQEDELNEGNEAISSSKHEGESSGSASVKKRSKSQKENKAQKSLSPVKKDSGLIKVVSKEATVKRFTEILEEQSTDNNEHLSQEGVERETVECTADLSKEVDDFFMTGDGNNTYLSVSVPRATHGQETEADLNSDKSFRKQRYLKDERFFSKIGKTNGAVGRTKRGSEPYQDDRAAKRPARFEKTGRNPDFVKKGRNPDIPKNDYKRAKANDGDAIENLHPSWAAKKKQLEIIKQGFQGKKIVFDDD